jgi:type IV pilus assembly protein PilW
MTSTSRPPTRLRGQRGFSLIELMVSIVLGLVIVASLAMLFANSSRARQETDKTNQQIENGRYASQYLLQDLRLAGYFGEFDPRGLPVPAAVAAPAPPGPDPSATDAASLAAALPIAVQGYHFGKNAATASAIEAGVTALLTDLRANSDVLVLRRASTCAAGSSGCDAMDTGSRTYFQTTLCQSQLSTLSLANQFVVGTTNSVFTATNPAVLTAPTFLAQRDCATAAATRSLYVRIYYVANNDNAGDGIPTLKVVELGAGAFNAPVPIAEGIEAMQVEYGADTNSDGAPELYTPDPANQAYKFDPADANTAWPAATYPAGGAPAAWHEVTAVKVHVLARNTQPSAGFVDARTYVLGSAGASDNTYGPYNDAYKRHVYTSVIRLNNVAGRVE